jgi:hypothetical protein
MDEVEKTEGPRFLSVGPVPSPAWAAERVRQFATIKDLLTADTPGTF